MNVCMWSGVVIGGQLDRDLAKGMVRGQWDSGSKGPKGWVVVKGDPGVGR